MGLISSIWKKRVHSSENNKMHSIDPPRMTSRTEDLYIPKPRTNKQNSNVTINILRRIGWIYDSMNTRNFFLNPIIPVESMQQRQQQQQHVKQNGVWNHLCQPPVIASFLGMIAVVSPIRGIFVDVVHRNSQAPLQWFYDGLYHVGQISIPINMILLGCHLSPRTSSTTSFMRMMMMTTPTTTTTTATTTIDTKDDGMFNTTTTLGIVIGKMIVLPLIGIISTLIFKSCYWYDIPPNVKVSFYLVMMIVFLCPTANNVMIMVELSESNTKEGIAQAIALQYAIAPLILGMTLTMAVSVATM
jgi:predicted permease